MLGPGIAAVGASVFDKALDFGFGAASAAMYEKQVRELRRKYYQDMTHSLKEAGLNPILALGGGLGGGGSTSAFQIQTGPSSVSSTFEKGAKGVSTAKQIDPVIKNLDSATNKNAANTLESVENAVTTRKQGELYDVQKTNTEADTLLKHAREFESMKNAGLLDASAKEVLQRMIRAEYENVKAEQDAKIHEGTEGEILRRIRAYSEAIQGISRGTGAK